MQLRLDGGQTLAHTEGRPVADRCLGAADRARALDRARAREVVDLLAGQTRAEGAATVMATPDPAILDAADRVHELSGGRLT